MHRRHRNTAIVLIAAGLFLLFGGYFLVHILIPLLLIWLGLRYIRSSQEKKGYVLLAVGCFLLLGQWFSFFVGIVFISLGYFYWKSRQYDRDESFVEKQSFLVSIRRDKEAWVLKNTGIWSVIGEIELDLSLALPDQELTTVVLQGVVGDIDILVPEDIGVAVDASVLAGQIQVGEQKQTGLINRLAIRSPNYDRCAYRVHFHISYIAGDINIRSM